MPDFTIKGDPGSVRSRASSMRSKADQFMSTGDGLAKVTTDGWNSRAADRFRDKFDTEPERWRQAGDGFLTAAGALEAYADALQDAQRRAAWAEQEYARGEQVTHDAKNAYDADVARARDRVSAAAAAGQHMTLTIIPFHDPGAAVRQGALDELAAAKQALDAAAHRCADGVRAGCRNAPEKRKWYEKVGAAIGGFLEGAGEALLDLGKLAAFLTNPAAWVFNDLMADAASGMTAEEIAAKWELKVEDAEGLLQALKDDPVEFGKNIGKAMLDWDTWADDPARALGHLVPDAIIAVLTAGSGTAATRGAKGGIDALDALAGMRRLDDLAGLRHLDDLGDLGDFRRLDDGLDLGGARAWDGEGGHLTPQQNAAADAYLRGASRAEKSITPDMERIADRSGGSLEGLDYRLKGEDSFKRKLATELAEPDSPGLDHALANMKDSVRYTYQFDGEHYADGVASARAGLQDAGYQEIKFKNTWGEEGYQGINGAYRTPDGSGTIEVQFHTPESLETKMNAHELYEERRLPETTPERVDELDRQMADDFARVPRPDGAGDLTPHVADPGGHGAGWGHVHGGHAAAGAHAGTSEERFRQETMR